MPKIGEGSRSADEPKAAKVRYVKGQGQSRKHHCHWPGCGKQVPPALWGCREHWMRLPKALRDAVWKEYRPGQEVNGTPSDRYLIVAALVRGWIEGKVVINSDGSVDVSEDLPL